MNIICRDTITHALQEGYKLTIRDVNNNYYTIKPIRLDDIVVYGKNDKDEDTIILTEDIENVTLVV